MSNQIKPAIQMIEENPEIKAYIYQQVAEFEPFVTPETVVSVVAKDPRQNEQMSFDSAVASENLSNTFRISITLTEGESQLQAEGTSVDIFAAIRIAKEALLNNLIEIHDSVVSTQDRQSEINLALGNNQIH